MVVFAAIPNLRVSICAPAKTLFEFDDPEADQQPRQVVKYVEAQSGEYFFIVVSREEGFVAQQGLQLNVSVQIDGRSIDMCLFPIDQPPPACFVFRGNWILRNGTPAMRYLKFEPIRQGMFVHGLASVVCR